MELTELMKLLAWLFKSTCRDCSRGTTAIINRKGRISLFCPRHAMEYLSPMREIRLRRKFNVALPTYIGDKPND
jgi:hypothetical protein